MMKKLFTLILLLFATMAWSGITTYTFTNAQWGSKIGTTACDGKTDGWTSDKDASGYDKEQTYKSPFGVKVTSNFTGAGATSVKSFDKVRRVTFHYGTTTGGKGSIRLKIGEWSMDTTVTLANPENKNLVICLPEEQSGKVSFAVNCTKNSIFINTITIRSGEGASPVFTEARYELVTAAEQLKDSDLIIIGVPTAGKLMGYFDKEVSKNNIHAISGKFTENGTVVAENDAAVYMLRQENLNGIACWSIIDDIRYYEAYLVANGGATKNRVAVWDIPTSPSYGNFGYWTIDIADGKATVMNLGTSDGKYLQYNASNSPTLFGCYANQGSQSTVSIYRRIEAIGDKPAIAAPLVRFDDVVLTDAAVSGSRTITVNANRLTQDITARLADGTVFSLSTDLLDRDGDELTITYTCTTAGNYLDTLVLSSDTVETIVPVMLTAVPTLSVAEAVQMPDYSLLQLGEVVVTKKYDQYIFVRDQTGSMLLYDNGDGKGGRYAQGTVAGDVLQGVQGKEWNYYGVPELNLTVAFSTVKKTVVEPEVITTLDSADVCRYVRIENALIENGTCTIGDKHIAVVDKFNTGLTPGIIMDLDAIVWIDHNNLQLWVVAQQISTGLSNTHVDQKSDQAFDLLGRPVGKDTRGMITIDANGRKRLQ